MVRQAFVTSWEAVFRIRIQSGQRVRVKMAH
jgi:hypothetical protein